MARAPSKPPLARYGFGSDSRTHYEMIYLTQMWMFFAGSFTLFLSIGFSLVGAKGPIVLGTSFAFSLIMMPPRGEALPALLGGVLAGCLFHAFLGTFSGRIRLGLPPLVTGLVALIFGLELVQV